MIKKRMKISTEEVWDKYKFSMTMMFCSGLIVGLTLSLIIIRWGMSLA